MAELYWSSSVDFFDFTQLLQKNVTEIPKSNPTHVQVSIASTCVGDDMGPMQCIVRRIVHVLLNVFVQLMFYA